MKKLGAEYNGHSNILGISWQSNSAMNKYAGEPSKYNLKVFCNKEGSSD